MTFPGLVNSGAHICSSQTGIKYLYRTTPHGQCYNAMCCSQILSYIPECTHLIPLILALLWKGFNLLILGRCLSVRLRRLLVVSCKH